MAAWDIVVLDAKAGRYYEMQCVRSGRHSDTQQTRSLGAARGISLARLWRDQGRSRQKEGPQGGPFLFVAAPSRDESFTSPALA